MGRGALPPPRQTAALPWGTWGCGHRCLGPPLTAWTCWSRAGHQGGELCHESESVPRGSVPWPEAEGCLCATHRPQPEGCFVPKGPPAVAASLGPEPHEKSRRSRLCSPCFHGVMSSSWTLAPFCCPPPKDLPWPLRPVCVVPWATPPEPGATPLVPVGRRRLSGVSRKPRPLHRSEPLPHVRPLQAGAYPQARPPAAPSRPRPLTSSGREGSRVPQRQGCRSAGDSQGRCQLPSVWVCVHVQSRARPGAEEDGPLQP